MQNPGEWIKTNNELIFIGMVLINTATYVSAGYTKQILPGYSDPVWVKGQ